MKKIILIIVIFLSLGTGIGSVLATYNQPVVLLSPVSERRQVVELPKLLVIPKLGISSHIEEVGEDENGRMGVPTYVNNVGWWNKGVRPGEVGNAVLDGHVDTPDGQKGVFYKIRDLVAGDEIKIVDMKSNVYTFEVISVESFPDDNFPLNLVFGSIDEKRLNLITCWGAFDRKNMNYLDRIVVFSRLKMS